MLSSRAVLVSVAGLLASLGFYLFATEAPSPAPNPALPLADTPYVLHDDLSDYTDFMMSGGPPPDGIPAIDDPQFVDADGADLDDGDMIIGFVHNGEARAYPQNIMVHHEIVNDAVGRLNVAVTYCPLTATAQGFKRGDTTLGVSGQLLNSNLVMFDRNTESYFSQIAATGLTGDHASATLDEVNLIWTTWDPWRAQHPETQVLSDDTGHMRNYSNDPYGRYNPRGGYYNAREVIFPLMHESDAHHPKDMVVGARTDEESVHFMLDTLEDERVLRADGFIAVYDERFHTGHIYEADEMPDVTPTENNRYEIDGESYAPDALPLDALVSIEAFFFAWNAFYPDSNTV
ncbi:MAG: DUF3179 domain-containing protein [Longimonas sp.]|uniref:DUF3179 domain-containing protein n=1 Tax=Longimonas sp. TaxID=2039626 RepID=UPI00397568A4